jgi:hypothetical protein
MRRIFAGITSVRLPQVIACGDHLERRECYVPAAIALLHVGIATPGFSQHCPDDSGLANAKCSLTDTIV